MKIPSKRESADSPGAAGAPPAIAVEAGQGPERALGAAGWGAPFLNRLHGGVSRFCFNDSNFYGEAMSEFSLDPLDLAALLCSRVCHDVISPVGAIVNGLEMLEDNKDADTRAFALELIKKSASTASAKLQFCRLAFGAAGSAGAAIDTGDAENVARGLLVNDRTKLDWNAPRILLAKNKVKLVLNMCLIAAATIPRGGVLTVTIVGEGDELRVESRGPNVRLAAHVPALIDGKPEGGTVDAHGIQAYYTGLVARECALALELVATPEGVTLKATKAETPAAASEDSAPVAPAA